MNPVNIKQVIRSMSFIVAGLVMAFPVLGIAADRPNIVVVVMDDFGVGACAAYSRYLSVEDMNPHLVELVTRGGRKFIKQDPQEALTASQQAMPFVARLADEGVRFESASATTSLCGPSRQALLSGRHPQRWGVYSNGDAERVGLPVDQACFPAFLQEAGYATACIGKYHIAKTDSSLRDKVLDAEEWTGSRHWVALRKANPELYKKAIAETGYCGSSEAGQHPLDRGFDYFFGYNWVGASYYGADNIWENRTFTGVRPDEEYNTELFTDKAVNFINRSLDTEKPVFLYLAYHAMHGTLRYKAPEKYMEKFKSSEPYVNSFYGHVNAVDVGVEKIFQSLEARGELENTLFIFTSDNGASGNIYGTILPHNAPCRGTKGSGWYGGVHVPFILWWPGHIQCNPVQDGMISLLNIMPTVLDAAGVEPPDECDGRSLVPLLKGNEDTPVHDALFYAGVHGTRWGFEDDHYKANDELLAPFFAAVRQGGWVYKIIGPISSGLYPDMPDGQAAQILLYDINADPGETMNRLSEYPEVAQSLSARLLQWGGALKKPLKLSPAKLDEVLPSVAD